MDTPFNIRRKKRNTSHIQCGNQSPLWHGWRIKTIFDDLASFLVDGLGFTANSYEVCDVNKAINGKQFAISWHVDNLKLSHNDATLVTSIITLLNDTYGNIIPLSISWGEIHEYLGMPLDFSITEDVKITMYDQIDNIIKELPSIYKSGIGSATTSPSHLYIVQGPCEDNELLTDK